MLQSDSYSEIREILLDSARRAFTDMDVGNGVRSSQAGGSLQERWSVIDRLGLPLALVSEAAGGLALAPADALGVISLAAQYGVSLPIGETLLANMLFDRAGLDAAEGIASVIPAGDLILQKQECGWLLRGSATEVPWGCEADVLLAMARSADGWHVVRLNCSNLHSSPGVNIANLARDRIELHDILLDPADVAAAGVGTDPERLFALGAVIRVLDIEGATRQALTLSLRYVQERVQFGRPIAKFQAIQQNMAILASQHALVSSAATLATRAFSEAPDVIAIAAAKAGASEAAGIVAALAHQLHGAIGFTVEHRLHLATRRLWAAREEFGNESFWNEQLGRLAGSSGRAGLWPMITTSAGER